MILITQPGPIIDLTGKYVHTLKNSIVVFDSAQSMVKMEGVKAATFKTREECEKRYVDLIRNLKIGSKYFDFQGE